MIQYEIRRLVPPRFDILVHGGRHAEAVVRRNGIVISFGGRETSVKHRLERLELYKNNQEVLAGLLSPDLHRLLPGLGMTQFHWETTSGHFVEADPAAREACWAFWDAVRDRPCPWTSGDGILEGLLDGLDDVAADYGVMPEGAMTDLVKAVQAAMKLPGFTRNTLMGIYDAQVMEGVMDR